MGCVNARPPLSIPRHVLLVTFSMLITRCAGQHRSLLQVDSKVSGAPVELAYKSLYRPETCGKSTAMFLAPPLKLAAGIPEYLPKRTFGRLFDAYRIQNVAEMQGCVCCHSGWEFQRVAEMQGCVSSRSPPYNFRYTSCIFMPLFASGWECQRVAETQGCVSSTS